MKKLVMGILAHVDAGKTTLSEAMLYLSGSIRKIGRVDKKDAFLDTYELEKARGITIFSKQAEMSFSDVEMTLLDTPGHVDFSTEMERTLQVLDYAILVISGADGCQGHTETLWRLLNRYQIPVFLFINKMDQDGTEKEKLLQQLRNRLNENCIDFTEDQTEEFYENVAMSDELLLDEFLQYGSLKENQIAKAIYERKVFPCYFGSALKLDGVEQFMNGLGKYTVEQEYPKEFGARIFKISRDEQGKRLTYMKITGGELKARNSLFGDGWEEKVNQIRIYSGTKYQTCSEVKAGTICAVTGLTQTKSGEGFGIESGELLPILEPVLHYKIHLPEDCDAAAMLPKLRQLEEEDPQLHITWNEELQEIQAQIMGDVQIEILQNLIQERFGVLVSFDTGNIVYKETIANKVEGVGHFEPLRHYAEVHLLLEPAEPGSGLVIDTNCSEDLLDKNWQRLILTHLYEKEHRGVLIGAPVTDIKITLVSGRAHKKHTEGGDFRQATYRAVRQGLRQAESIILEPYYDFRMELPESEVGRAMMDVDKMYGTCKIAYDEEIQPEMTVLIGSAPVACMRGYQREFASYTKGYGRLFCELKGYEKCHNQEEVLLQQAYDPEADLDNPTGSVFCAHGVGFLVEWDKVKDYMHLDSVLAPKREKEISVQQIRTENKEEDLWIGDDEVEQIFRQTFYANKTDKSISKKKFRNRKPDTYATATYKRSRQTYEKKEKYLLVDGYNIIFAWKELSELAKENIDSARDKLLDILSDYHGTRPGHLIVVFDAYRVKGHDTEIFDFHNIHVVYTKEAETADAFIEKFAHENGQKYDVTVATSDHMEQIIITGQGCQLISARELEKEVDRVKTEVREQMEMQVKERNTLGELLKDF
ncbi:MAG: TetM/TetW/TetO/TetS family tetracycline resistance ribosomal protection protein [Lachnospiraceae bacterium]|nr:TetM/TetW/TetO/TetS family tetracycline resistance ribosomal protection protein [Lachnospiraceae bacterium]